MVNVKIRTSTFTQLLTTMTIPRSCQNDVNRSPNRIQPNPTAVTRRQLNRIENSVVLMREMAKTWLRPPPMRPNAVIRAKTAQVEALRDAKGCQLSVVNRERRI